ncbi:hypothetical protein M4I32_14600 [Microbacterium sp. LRZ72]|nr:hypothetical protein [Microbacterium sp. LRZ72]MDX2378023.1 hypothetical protein [Microbacterium sp. LRZ72]
MPVDEVSRSGLPRIRIDRTLPLPTEHPRDPEVSHKTFDRAAGNVVLVTAQAEPKLAGAEDLPLLPPGREDDRLPAFVGQFPR